MKITRQLLLPDSVCKHIKATVPNCDLSDLIRANYKTITFQKYLWRVEVETYMSILIDAELHRKVSEEAIKLKVDSNLLIRTILFRYLK